VKLTGGGFPTFHAAHAAGSKALEELLEKILKEQTSAARRFPNRPCRSAAAQQISYLIQRFAQFE
jgi:hypothetical protein